LIEEFRASSALFAGELEKLIREIDCSDWVTMLLGPGAFAYSAE